MKAAREKKQVTYKRTPIRLLADFLTETLQDRREWHDILNVMKGKNLQPRLLYPARLSFRFFFFFLSFCYFFGPLPRHMEGPRLGVESEL